MGQVSRMVKLMINMTKINMTKMIKKKVKIIDQIEMFRRMASILSSNRDEAG